MSSIKIQKRIYNKTIRRYLDEKDLKEGESICRKCKGVGKVEYEEFPVYEICPQCLGHGIVDWVTQAVERPPVMSGSASSSSYTGTGKTNGPFIPYKSIVNPKMVFIKKVTNYKRRKIV